MEIARVQRLGSFVSHQSVKPLPIIAEGPVRHAMPQQSVLFAGRSKTGLWSKLFKLMLATLTVPLSAGLISSGSSSPDTAARTTAIASAKHKSGITPVAGYTSMASGASMSAEGVVFMEAPMQDRAEKKEKVEDPGIPNLDFSHYKDKADKQAERLKKLKETEKENAGHRDRAAHATHRYYNSADPFDQDRYRLYYDLYHKYKKRVETNQAEAADLNAKIADLNHKHATAPGQIQKELIDKWGKITTWLDAKRQDPQDPRLKQSWPQNIQVLTSGSQDYYSWMNSNGSRYVQDLAQNIKTEPSLLAAHRKISGYVPIAAKEVGLQRPMESLNTVNAWNKADNEKMGPYRRVLLIMGEENPGDNYDEEAFQLDMINLREMMAKQFNVPKGNVTILNRPSEEQVRKAFADMETFAKDVRKKKGAPEPECLVVIGGHGAQGAVEPGLPETDVNKEGARIGYVVMQQAKGKDPGFWMTDTLIKELTNQHIKDHYRAGYVVVEACKSGTFLAKESPLIDRFKPNHVNRLS